MSGRFVIEGARPLKGHIHVEGAKNAALPMLAAVLLCHDTVTFKTAPDSVMWRLCSGSLNG